jgi:hypothetical protein
MFGPEFQAIVIAAIGCPLMMLFHVVFIRIRGADRGGHLPLYSAYAAYLVGWLLAAWLWFGAGLSLPLCVAGLAACVFGCLAYMQVYSQICRGFSLRIMVDIDRCGELPMEGILEEYADGRGAQWLLDKRIDTMCGAGLVRREGDRIVLASERARTLGRIGILFKQIVKPAQGG